MRSLSKCLDERLLPLRLLRRIRADDNTMVEIIGSFDEALGKTLKAIVAWTLQTGHMIKGDKRKRNK